MSPELEAMAKEIARCMAVSCKEPADSPWVTGPAYLAARAALLAIRQPSSGMCKAACKAMSPERRPTPNRVGVRAKHGIRYRAMIDHILNGEPE